MIIMAAVGSSFVLLLVVLHLLASPRDLLWHLDHGNGHKCLVVLVHGVTGRARFEPAVALAREALPASDLLVFDYDSRVLSNANPYEIATRHYID